MNRYIHTFAIMLAAWLTASNGMALSTGVRIHGNVFGGGNLATVGGSVTVNIKAGTVTGDVYGGGALANTNINNIPTESYTGTGTEEGNTFTYTTTVNLTGGEIHGDAYGGGLGQMGTAVEGVHWTQEEIDAAQEGDDAYGKTTDDWKVEPVEAGADGAGAVKAMVYGDVNVTLGSEGGSTATKFYINHYEGEHAGVVKSGRVFGCNNLNGSPLGNVTVTVWKTVAGSDTRTTETVKTSNKSIIQNNPDNYESVEGYVSPSYELAAVYGGGNLANYTATGKKASVRIETCEVSIQDVYGGGNAAAVPETDVLVRGAYEIQEVFGGGNGKDPYTINDDNNWTDNPGANVNSNATTLLTGGYIHEAYGGSNKRGTIFGSVSIDMSDGSAEDNTNGQCTLLVEKLVGAGKDADVNGDLIMVMGCKPNTKTALLYAGADNANVNGNVELTITSGKFGKVFGGNNKGGIIMGHIKLNIEETGECNVPIEIDELYLGGNEAAYSQYGYYKNGADFIPRTAAMADITDPTANGYTPALTTEQFGATVRNETPYAAPELNIVSCTYIGKVFGGGYGTGATLYGNPTVNINMIQGSNATGIPAKMTELGIDASKAPNPNNLGIIGDVYGGGDAANVIGNTTVKICTVQTVQLHQSYNVSSGEYSMSENQNVLGAYISGNVFGGGKGVDTDVTKALLDGNGSIVMAGGTVLKSVYGGGELSQVSGDTHITVIGGTIGTTGEGGATYGNIYGGGFGSTDDVRFGLIKGDTYVTIRNEVADADYADAHDGVNEGDILSTPIILHNIYGGGAYGSVGTFTYESTAADAKITDRTSGGTTYVTVSGGTIGTTGQNNGMIFGSSRGDVGAPGSIHDKLAWVYDTHVTIGTSGQGTTPLTINGSVYGGGENGHNYHDAEVIVHSGTIGIHDGTDADGTRGNVYGGGCGTDKYYIGDIPSGHTANDGEGTEYNSLAGIVYGDATITMDGGLVKHNIYGAGAMGSVGDFEKDATTSAITFNSGGTTTITISGGTVGVDGSDNGNVFGAARGDKAFTDRDLALVNTTSVTISGSTQIKGNVYGGGEVGNVQTDTRVDVQGGAIAKNVFGGGKGVEDLFTCEQAMVGVDGEGAGANLDADVNKDKGTIVTITNGTVGTLNEGALVEGTGNVYGGGEIGRVEWNAQVIIGSATGTSTPVIHGNVFGAGKGLETHGYSALVRGNSTVTVQGGAKVGHCVYGGGENSTVGRYWVKGINNSADGAPPAPEDLPDGMPYQQQSGGICRVTIQGNAVIGGDNNADLYTGHVFGAGRGVVPHFNAGTTNRMVNNDNGGSLVAFADKTDATTGEVVKTAKELYLEFLQTLSLATNAYVTIDGSAHVKGSVFGGSESGFVQTNTDVRILNGTIGTTASYGNVFGGGRGLEAFAEAGKVKGTTEVTISGGTAYGNVYGGGNLGDVGIIAKNTTDYNYTWNRSDGVTANAHYNNTITGTNTNTGICKVTIAGGTIGVETTDEPTKHGNVFGAGKGLEDTFWCEKGIVYSTNVNINKGTVNGNVYGGGEVGRVETDAIVKVEGTADIKGNVFGAGAGKETHGYSALVRGNTTVTVQGSAAVGKSVYGGGEIASVGKYGLDNKNMPSILMGGGYCYVTVQGNATVGADVFGAGEGVKSHFNNTDEDLSKRSRRMTLKSDWVSREGADRFDWDYLTESNYPTYLETLALATHPEVTIDGSASIGQSVYGGGELGLTKGSVIVNIKGGTITEDVYGGGSLANTNTTSTVGHTDADGNVTTETVHPTTTVNLLGGTVTRNVYGGGLGQKEVKTGETVTTPGIEAIVYGDVNVNLNGTTTITTDDATGNKTYTPSPNDPTKKGCVVKGNVFGANNVNGTPLGHVLVYVHGTQNENTSAINVKADGSYDVAKVFGGGNQADYVPTDTKQSTEVIIEGCDLTSIDEVYGGGYGAAVPGTNILIKGTKIIDNVFGGGYGASTDDFTNPGANVGYLTDGTEYGAADGGKAVVQLMAGTVNHVYGGSNSLGNIRGGSNVTSVARGLGDTTPSCCTELKVQDIFGGGKNADMFGGAEIVLGCMPNDWVGAIYAGAESSDIGHDVSLTLTSGKFGRVFGGNKSGGKLNGGIEVNIEENGSCGTPIIIGELYGGGNEAPYSIYGYKDEKDSNGKWIPRLKADYDVLTDAQKEAEGIKSGPNHDPVLNIRAFTSIGNIFGGGYGQTAKVVGNPIVNINEVEITHTDTDDAFEGNEYAGETKELKDDNNAITNVVLYPHKDGKMGVIGNVFGGGNAAEVIGNTNVNIGTETEVGFESLRTSEGVPMKTVKGADIRGNVYGGGNAAEVTGNTNVVIGKEKVTTP